MNELVTIDTLIKSILNEKNKNLIQLLQYNNINIILLLKDVQQCSYLHRMQDGKNMRGKENPEMSL